MTSFFFIGFEMHSRTGLGTNYLLSMWHRFGNTETVDQAPTLSHTLSTPLTGCKNIARRADFSNREINTEQPSRCTSSFVSTCRRASPRNLLGNVEKKKSTPPNISNLRRTLPGNFQTTTTRKYVSGEEAGGTLKRIELRAVGGVVSRHHRRSLIRAVKLLQSPQQAGSGCNRTICKLPYET